MSEWQDVWEINNRPNEKVLSSWLWLSSIWNKNNINCKITMQTKCNAFVSPNKSNCEYIPIFLHCCVGTFILLLPSLHKWSKIIPAVSSIPPLLSYSSHCSIYATHAWSLRRWLWCVLKPSPSLFCLIPAATLLNWKLRCHLKPLLQAVLIDCS